VSVRRRLRTSGWLASAALVAALSAPAGAVAATDAVAHSESATRGAVTAELSYVVRTRKSGGFQFDEYTKVRAAIRRGELDRRSIFDVSPLRFEYLRALKRFLRRTGYLG
jgi:hypothetical protein